MTLSFQGARMSELVIGVVPVYILGFVLESLPGQRFRAMYRETNIFVSQLHCLSHNIATAAMLTAVFSMATAISEQVL